MQIPILILNKAGIVIVSNGKRHIVKGPLYSLRKYAKLRGKSLVIGYVGARGAGKSVNAARDVAINMMLRGKKVWSNMDIAFYLADPATNTAKLLRTERFSKLKLRDLDNVYEDGCIYIDEINMEIAEARRSMSGDNLTTNNIIQQLRKRRLNLIWSAQSEMHVDARVRWQTDIFIKCVDVSKPNGPGELSHLKYYDYSGVLKGQSPSSQKDAIFHETTICNKPWWGIYDTWQLQGVDDEEKQLRDDEQEEVDAIAGEIFTYLESENRSILSSELWLQWGIESHKEKIQVGVALTRLGAPRMGQGGRYRKINYNMVAIN